MKKISQVFALVTLTLLTSTGFVSADIGDEFGCGMGNMMYGTYGFGPMFYGWIFGVLVIVALVLLIIWLIKQIQKK